MIRRIAVTMALAASAGLSPVVASAQAGARDLVDAARQEVVERIQERFENRIARELRLDGEQREVLGEVFSVFARSRADILSRRREIERRIGGHLAGDGTEEDALGLLEEMRALREREAELLREEEDRLLEVLTPSQVLRLQALRDQFGNVIRRLRRDSGQGNPGDRPFRGPGRRR